MCANEFIHKDVGTELTEAEYDSVGAHVFNSQATGDILYASSATQLSRLGITASRILGVSGGIPAWVNTLPAFTLGGTVTLNGQVFDAGAGSAQINTTGSGVGFTVQCTNDGVNGARINLTQISTTAAADDVVGFIRVADKDDGGNDQHYGLLEFMIESSADGSEAGKMRFRMAVGAAWNEALTLSSAGGLGVDADIGTADDPVALFDDYDDAIALRQGIQQRNQELLADMGVFTRKDTGSGYMMNIQPMVRLLAGGIYQTRQMVDDLTERIAIAERKLVALPQGG